MRTTFFTATLLALLPGIALSETYEVKMLNRGETGSMVYEPDFLALQPGDTIRFIATHPSHNAVSIPEIWPEAAPQVKGQINKEIEVPFEALGIYGIKCSPHYTMGMVMLVQVGDGDLDESIIATSLPDMVQERLTDIVERNRGS
ncbi:pseudoazurin [Paracoccus sp. R86501]|uniref:pseudoazurin n=1 Tax=Paracoccus sp. R86501 TaxID=3101711 RepID=UPI00366E1BBF